MKKTVTLFCTALLFLLSTVAFAQTTYTWNGGAGAWNVATNWTPTRTTPAATDIIQFNDGGTYTVTAVPTQTIRQLLVTNNTNVSLQSSVANQTLSINGPASTDNLLIQNGSTLSLASATATFTLRYLTGANQQGDISGTLIVNANNNFTTNTVATTRVNVSSTGQINHAGGVITATAATLNFAANSNYNYLGTGALTIPTATWDAASNVNITGITAATTIGGTAQSFGNCTYNCLSQGNVAATFAATSTTRFKGAFNLLSTGAGTGSVSFKNGTAAVTLNVDGDFNVSGGLLNANIGGTNVLNMNIAGDVNISGGAFNLGTQNLAGTFNFDGNFNQIGGIFQRNNAGTTVPTINFRGANKTFFVHSSATFDNSRINLQISFAGASLRLLSDLIIPASRTFTASNGTLFCDDKIISGAGTFTLTSSANASLGIGDLNGITAAASGTGATAGNIRTTVRAFGIAANYIYTGTNGQVTGNGLPVGATGYIQIDLQNNTDQITFTNTAFSGTGVNIRLRSGSLANAITYTNVTNSILTYEGVAAQTTTNNEFPATNGPRRLTINNPNGVTLHASRALPTNGILTLTEGILTTTATELLTVQNTAVAAVVGGSETAYVNGPLIRAINTVGIYAFPVGDAATYGGYAMQTYSNASVQLRVQFVNSASGGSAGVGLTTLNNYHWLVDRTSGSASLSFYVTLTKNGLVNDSRVGYATALTGAYTNIGGNNIGTSITSVYTSPVTIDNTNTSAYLTVGSSATLSGTISANNLTEIANVLRTNIVTGNVIFELPTSYTGEPAYPVVFTSFAEDGGGPYNVTIRPETGSTNVVTAGAAPSGIPLIDFNDIDRLTIDGRAGGSGGIVWTFRNTNTATTAGATFRFISDATFNTLTYLNIEGQSQASQGNIFFSTSVGGTLGNSNNTISNCHIRDRSDVSGNPLNGIFSLGTSGVMNTNNQILDNHIYNFWSNTLSISGIFVSSHSSNWTISGNHLYQTASRTLSSATVIKYGIQISTATGNGTNFNVSENYIGGSEANATGTAWTTTGNFNHSFVGISISTLATGNNSIESNVIRNFSLTHGATANTKLFVGIDDLNGNNFINNNTIGSTTSSNQVNINSNLATASVTYGIFLTSGTDTVSNNTIAGVNLTSTTGLVGFTGVHTAVTSGSPTVRIENNTIAKISAAYTSTTAGGFVRGIFSNGTTTAGARIITGNTIGELSTATANTGAANLASTVGIVQLSTVAGHVISGNTIYALQNTNATAVTHVIGIFYNGATSGTNIISRNFIHSLKLSTSNGTASMVGIMFNAGLASITNNMIRLGIDAAGNSITNAYAIDGIRHISATAGNVYYFNTVYIGGTGVSGNSNSFAFQRTAGTTALNLRNNIFFNERATTSGTGFNYAVGLSASTAVTCDYNIYKTDGANGRVGLIGATPYTTLPDWQNTFTSNDINSLYGPMPFINETGNATNVDLHISTSTPSQNESAGIYIADYGDFDGDIRFGETGYAGSGTKPDIGADEGEFLAADLTPPAINYTPITTQTVLTGPVLSATITDASGVNITTGTAPRIYFKYTTNSNTFNDNTNTTNGWKYVESTTGSSPFSFTIDYSLLFGGTPTGGETIEYFVVAQDLASPANIGINNGDFAAMPSSVALTSAAFPLTGTINSYYINVLNGTYTVGTGGDFTSLTNAGGLFQTINTASLSGNVIAEITTDLTAELGTHALNQWIEIAGSGYTLTIRPSAAATRTISGNQNLELFRLDGADRVTIDGRFGGSGQYLIFANTSTGAASATFSFLNEATNNTIRYAFLRGSSTATAKGVLLFGTSAASGTLGNSNNTIEYCDIHQHAAALPRNGIYSNGTASKLNVNNTISNNNIYNFFIATGGSNGIALAGNTSAWTIENNKFYQEATRTTTTASSFHYVININNTSNASTVIRGNYIGGNAANGTGTMTYTAAVGNQFAPIYLNTNGTTANAVIVENNTITNIAFTTLSAATSGIGPYTAIYQLAGASRITGNTIGAATGTGAITVTVNTNASGVTNAIRYDGASTVKIENNTIGSISVVGTGTNNAQNFYAVNVTTGNAAVKNNLVGSSSTANSIQITGTATSNTSVLGGINIVSTASYSDTVSFNTIYNLTNFNGGTGTRILGISATSGAQYIIEDNTIRNLSLTASTNVGTTSIPAVLGIALVTSNTQALSLSRNIIHSLSNGGSGASAWTTGIHYSGGTSGSNVVEQNFVHSLSPSSGATASVVGIQLAGGTTTTARNNMVRLGIASNGTAITQSHNIFGIQQTVNNIHNIFHNSIYIGGTVVAGALPTFAYHRNIGTITTATSLRNNIFVNNRSNGAGTGVHYAVGFSTAMTTTLTSDNNLFHTNGTGGTLGLMGATTYATLADWKTGTSKDAVSLYGDPQFIDATGNASDVDLHISAIVASPAESNGSDVGVTADYDSEDRASRTPTDIGADAGDFLALDIVAPVITYTNAPGVCNTSSTHVLNNVTIEDVLSDINVTAGTKPRLYYKKSTDANNLGGWQFVEATGTTSPFSFNINLTALGSINSGDIVQYFVVAQDEGPIVFTPNVSINSGSFAATQTSVALGTSAFPIGGTLNSFTILPCSGTVTVGTGGAFPSLTNPGGLFEAINLATLSGDVTAEIISDLTVETGTHPLNQWAESGVGNYSVTIRPDGNTLRTITGTYAGAAATAGIYRINGADRFTIDGRDPNNLGAGGRHLLFRNTNATASNNFNSTFNVLNDANNLVFRNLIIEGATVGTFNGVFRIDSEGTGDGNDFITITENQIRDRSDAAGIPTHGIYIVGTLNRVNDNISITNNEIFNYHGTTQNAAIYVGNYNTDFTITGNSIFEPTVRTTASNKFGILIDASIGSGNINVSNNFIGGSAAGATDTWLVNSSGNYSFSGISMSTEITGDNVVENNIIRNFNITTASAFQSQGSLFAGIIASNGDYEIRNNIIGGSSGNITIRASAGQFTSVYGIYDYGSGGVSITNNTIRGFDIANTTSSANIINMYGIRAATSSITDSIFVTGNTVGGVDSVLVNASGNIYNTTNAVKTTGIYVESGRPTTISNNKVSYISYNAGGQSSSTSGIGNAFQVAGIYRESGSGSNTIENNLVNNITSLSPYQGSGLLVGLCGIYVDGPSTDGQLISGNIIHSIKNNNAGSSAQRVYGLLYDGNAGTNNVVTKNIIHSLFANSSGTTAEVAGLYINSGNALVTNNMIRIGIDETGTAITRGHSFNGIHDAAGANNYYHNSVYVGGSGVASGAIATHAFFSAVGTGARAVQNNIFWNARSNGAATAKHFAIRTGAHTSLTISHNLLFANGTGGVLGNINGTDNTSLGAFGTGNVSADPEFIDPTGNASNVDLHIKIAPVETPIEAVGTPIAAVTIDIDGDIRADNTPVDLGADAGDFVPADRTAPDITNVTAVANISVACGTTATVNISATVTDAGSGVATGSLEPQLWWRLSTGTYAAAAPVSVSGNVYNYELNLTGLVGGQTYDYYIAAQDNDGNIGYSHSGGGTPVHSDVATFPSTINTAPATFSVLTNTPLSGTVTVGSGGDYATFNGIAGLFAAINSFGLKDDLTVRVISNITETANTPLNTQTEYCGTGYIIRITPNDNNVRIVSGIISAPLIDINGAFNVTFDGRDPSNPTIDAYNLIFRNTTTSTHPAMRFNNGARIDSVMFCQLEARTQTPTSGHGVLVIGGAGITGNQPLDSIVIYKNKISWPSNLTTPALADIPQIGIQFQGSATSSITNLQIIGNSIFNWQTAAIASMSASNGTGNSYIGNGIIIDSNKIYQTFNIPTYQYPISLSVNGFSYGHKISNNLIGGSSEPNPNIAGTWQNNNPDGEVVAIYVNVDDAPTNAEATSIQGNKIQNFNISGTGWTNFVGIRVQNGRVRIGDEVGNVIGSEDNSVDNIISNGSGGSFITEDAAVMGIWTQSGEEVVIENNIVSGLSTGLGTFCFLDGIVHGSNLYYNDVLYNSPGGKSTIRNNQIKNNRSSSNLSNSAVSNEGMMSLFVHTNSMENLIEGNLIQNNGCNALVNANVRNHGVMLGILGQAQNHGGIFRKNTIAALANANAGAASPNTAPEVNGLVLNHGNWEVSNNMISLRNGTTGTNITNRNTFVIGIRDHLRNLTGQGATYHYNSVYIYGSNSSSGTANPSYNYLRIPNNTGSVAGAPVTLRNNVFINERTGVGSHRAIGNINSGSPATGWNATASDYNFIATLTSGTATRWGVTDYNITNWRSISGGDANTDYFPVAATTIANTQLNPADLFESDFLFGNLRISLLNADATDFIDGKATPIAITDDIDGDVRDGSTPDKGADEFFTTCPPITIGTQPSPNNICEGSNTFFTASATGVGITYQWQVDTGSGFTDITNGAPYANAQTDQLNINNTPESFNGYEYRVVISSTCTTAVNSAEVTLTVNSLPEITVEPVNATVAAGSNTSFGITATGSGTLTYVWQLSTDGGTNWSNAPNSAPYSNVNTATLNITAATAGMNNYQYRVIVNNGCNIPDTSTVAVLTVTVSCTDNTWTGTVNTLWEVAGNWSCGIVPDTSMNVIIPNVTNDPVISVSVVGGVKDVTIQASAILTMIDNTILQVSGNFENNGTFDFSGNSTVVLLGTRAQTIKSSWTTGTTNSFNNLTIDKANANTVTPTDNIKVNEKTMVEKGELVIAEDIVARSKKVELKDKLLIEAVSGGTKAGEFRVNE